MILVTKSKFYVYLVRKKCMVFPTIIECVYKMDNTVKFPAD